MADKVINGTKHHRTRARYVNRGATLATGDKVTVVDRFIDHRGHASVKLHTDSNETITYPSNSTLFIKA